MRPPRLIMKRSDVPIEFQWQTSDIYASDEVWQQSYDETGALVTAIETEKASFTKSGSQMYHLLKKIDEAMDSIEKVYVYAMLRSDQDSANTFYQGLKDMASNLNIRFSASVSFIEPALLSLDTATLDAFFAEKPELKLYSHYIDNVVRMKDHILSEEMEELLSKAADVAIGPRNVYSMLNNADMQFPDIKDENGNMVTLTHGKFIPFMESPDRRVRIDAFNALYDTYIKQKNTIAALYSASVKKDVFFSTTRKYKSSMESKLFSDNIPVGVYKNLIETVTNYLPHLHRYVELRKKRLGLDELHMYDLYTPIIKDADIKVDYETAKSVVLKALAPMGEEYVSYVNKGFNEHWVDIYENEGKRSGAYSCGIYSVHPFVLMNYNDTLDNMFTLAHEMGHAMHSYYTSKEQEIVYGDYTIFLAEVASTVNESLLMDYLLKTETDKTKRELYLNKYLEGFRGTVFRQTMFAEFEMIAHEMAESNKPLTAESLSAVYRQLNIKYYGNSIIVDDKIDYEWSRIPHFYSPFYVFQYATGYSAAVALAKKILAGGKNVDDYLGFLKSGSSDYSINILKKAGVDMSSPQPIAQALDVFAGLVTEMENLS